ncbi:hypothetical protein IAU60_003629 [Kwoniella sp. DSM 27419]
MTSRAVPAEGALVPTPTLDLTSSSLARFTPTRVLSESTSSGSVYVLGTLEDLPAIVHVQKAVLSSENVGEVVKGLERLEVFLENQPYFSAHAWQNQSPARPADLNIKVICPATTTHIRKYSQQAKYMVLETREVYDRVVEPYIAGFDESRLAWVYAILEGRKEADRVLFRSEGEGGFVITPDLKWDQTSMSALYLTVLVQTRRIRTLRDLTPADIPLLRSIKQTTIETVWDRYKVQGNELRMFVHYQPSYYHFHVHVVHVAHEPMAGMLVGQAHMLDDLISLLELSPSTGPSLLAQKAYSYPLGEEHGLFEGMKAAGALGLAGEV